jgi:hypothetical protein
MANLLEATADLHKALVSVKEKNPNALPRTRQAVEEAISTVEGLMRQLTIISEAHLDLSNVDISNGSLRANMEFWNSFGSGTISGKEIAEIVRSYSVTLDILHRGALDIRSVYKFTPEELKFALELGDKFERYGRGWQAAKQQLYEGQNRIEAHMQNARIIADFLDFCVRKHIIRDYRFEVFIETVQNEARYKQINLEAAFNHRGFRNERPIRFLVDGVDPHSALLVRGNWFTAYAYAVFNDQLNRLKLDYEIYTMVKFQSAGSGQVTGDFDVIINVRNTLFLIECKSGKIAEDGNNSYREIARKVETVKTIFESTRIKKYTFLLLCNPSAVDSREAEKRLAQSNIRVLTPAQMRTFVVEYLEG